MHDEPHAKPYPTIWHARMCSEGVFRCVSGGMGQRTNIKEAGGVGEEEEGVRYVL